MNTPTNYTTGSEYRGSNVAALTMAAHAHGYKTNQWAGYHQLADAGLQVRKGEHGTRITVVFPDPRDAEKTRVTTRTVFNVAQCDIMTPKQCAAYAERKAERKARKTGKRKSRKALAA